MHFVAFVGALLLLLGVALGAFGTHALAHRLDESSMRSFQTGVQYQRMHGFAVLVVFLLSRWGTPSGWWLIGAWVFVAGVVLFSGSLYALAFMPMKRPWVYVTPLGGLMFLAGWLIVALKLL